MASIFSHPTIPAAIGLALGRRIISRRLLFAGVVCSIAPDLDVIAFDFGIPYAHVFGHRGFTHSIFFAVLTSLVGLLLHSRLDAKRVTAFFFLFVATLSHGVLDALTTGGLGIAFFWPLEGRYFLPWQVVQVAPIGFSRFFSPWGLAVLKSELVWIWLPMFVVGILGLAVRTIWGSLVDRTE